MYNSQEIANRIKTRVKICGTTMKVMLGDLELGINIVSHLAKGQEMSFLNLAKIADYLDCSVDYLLGRTDNPNISGNNISNVDTTINGTQANIIQDSHTDLDEINTILSTLSNSKRHRAIADMLDLLEEKYI